MVHSIPYSEGSAVKKVFIFFGRYEINKTHSFLTHGVQTKYVRVHAIITNKRETSLPFLAGGSSQAEILLAGLSSRR